MDWLVRFVVLAEQTKLNWSEQVRIRSQVEAAYAALSLIDALSSKPIKHAYLALARQQLQKAHEILSSSLEAKACQKLQALGTELKTIIELLDC